MAAELERMMGTHAEAVEECAVLGLNVAVFEPVAQQQKKKKTKAKPTEQEVTTFTVPESNLDRDIRRIIETTRLSAGSMFAACGAMALSVLVGLIERENKTEKEKRVKAKAAHAERIKLQAAGKAILARQCTLGGKELKISVVKRHFALSSRF